MTNNITPRSPRAVTAIAAVLALSAIPFAATVQAQEAVVSPAVPVTPGNTATTPAVPTVTLPPEATAPTAPVDTATTSGTSSTAVASPAVVLPNAAPPPVEAQPVQAAGQPSEQARPAARANRTATASSAPRVPTAESQGTAARPALAQGSVPPATATPAPATTQPEAAPPVAAAPTPAVDGSGRELPVAGIVGLLAALGAAGLGIAAMRRRRDDRMTEEAEYEAEPLELRDVAEPIPSVAPAAPVAAPAGFVTTMDRSAARPTSYGAAANTAGAILASSPMPQTADERRDLLERMVAAEPDEDNPFTSHKSRMRRARIQLAHREQAGDAAPVQGRNFDFRDYRSPGQAARNKSDLIDA